MLKNNRKDFFFITKTIVSLFSLLFFSCHNKTISDTYKYPFKFEDISEVDDQVLFFGNEKLIFSKNTNGIYQLYAYDLAKKSYWKLSSSKANIKSPFFFDNKLLYLKEDDNSKKYQVAGAVLNSKNFEFCSKVFSSKTGKYSLFIESGTEKLYFQSSGETCMRLIPQLGGAFNAACFSEDLKVLIISSGDKLWKISLPVLKIKQIAVAIKSKKLNPFIFRQKVYFSSSNNNSDHYNIYSINIASKKNDSSLLEVASSNDLKMPETDGSFLYYIEIINSEYLLRRKNISTSTVDEITKTGVVYNYFIKGSEIIFIYSDLRTPRSIKIYDPKKGVIWRVDSNSLPSFISANLIAKKNGGKPAYELSLLGEKKINGVILYFHPGRKNDDFSPRWDNMLFPFCEKNYLIIAPNYPSSSGYGITYENQSQDSAINYMNDWLQEIRFRYPGLPIYLYGISSGCPILEKCIKSSRQKISGAICAFGLPSQNDDVEKVPIIYILGRHDPVVPYEERILQLQQKQERNPSIKILTLDEGHWIQNPGNFYRYFDESLNFFRQ